MMAFNFFYLCTPTRPRGTVVQVGNAVTLAPPTVWLGEPVTGAWVETSDGQVAIRWGRVPARVASGPTLMDQVSQGMGRPM